MADNQDEAQTSENKQKNKKKGEAVHVVRAGYTVNTGEAIYEPGDEVDLPAAEIKRLKKAGIIEVRK